ncbi:MAG TPA: tetratricopeptide repeat protein [Xanthobacteraceae bacterium]|nr:tetratricopeptide repeat protein [Xanthobacteraceae bacterium]
MRTFDRIVTLVLIGVGLGLTPVFAFEGAKPSGDAQSSVEAFRSGAEAWQNGEKAKAVTSLQYAAEHGHPLAQWQLGRMYAAGDGVPRSDLRAFEYFSRIANGHADDNPGSPEGRLVANAFVALGQYYLDGIPDSQVRPDPSRARELFSYAASYFGDPDAQYHLARLYLDGIGLPRDPRLAARWLGLAANKRQYQAQAVLGQMLFKGDSVPRQGALGLMWLTLARESDVPWINELYSSAFKQATAEERALALVLLDRWLKTRRD